MEKKKTVCHLTSVHPPFDIRIFYKECVSLTNAGYQVSLIAPIQEATVRMGVSLVPVSLPGNRFMRMLIAPFRMLRLALQQKAQIYHFHDPELMLTGVLLRLAGKKVIFDVHENIRISLISKDWLPLGWAKFLAVLYYLAERVALLFYKHLVLAEESYQKYYPQKKSITVLNFPLNGQQVLNPKGYKEPWKFIYAGVVHPLRGVWEMLEILNILNRKNIPVSLDLIGEMRPENLRKQVEDYLHQNNLFQLVTIHGKIDFTEVAVLLSNSHMGFSILHDIPNYRESLPTKIFEYMQHGLPVITNDFPLYKKYVEATNTGLCLNVNRPEEQVNAILDLLNHPRSMEEMGKNGMELTQNRFNWKSQEAKLLELYASL
ncbi:MAG: glycosyltransferase [Salinivirgaceae bacterium]